MIPTLTPNVAPTSTRPSRRYEAVQNAILEAIGERELACVVLADAVSERLPAEFRGDRLLLGCYITCVKHELEARGLIERVPGARPQRLRRSAD